MRATTPADEPGNEGGEEAPASSARDAGTHTWISTGSLTLGAVATVLTWLAVRRARSRRRRAQP